MKRAHGLMVLALMLLPIAAFQLGPWPGAVLAARPETGGTPVPHGLMAFGRALNFLDTKALDLPYISGMTAYFGWRDLEKEDGVHDFKDLDHMIALAKKNGKIINIMINPGNHAPEWLFRKGVKSFSWDHDFYEDQWRSFGRSKVWTSPVPWDPIFLEHWKRFITKLAERYGSEPTVGYISLTGPAVKGITTNLVVKNDDDWRRLLAGGYSDEKMQAAWIDVIEHYHKVLPAKRLVLGVAPDRRGKADIGRARAVMEYVMSKRYTNISFMIVFLNDTWFETARAPRELRGMLKEAKARGFSFGYQMAQSAHRNAGWKRNAPIVKSLKDSLALGIGDGASWIEVWHDDIIVPRGRKEGIPNDRYVADLKWAQEALMGSAAK